MTVTEALPARPAPAIELTEPDADLGGGSPRHLSVVLPTAVVFVALGVAYLLWFNPLVRHIPTYAVGGDLWGIYRGAHYIGWGYLGGVYAPGNGVVALPGMELLLAPVAMITGHFNMTESYGPFNIPRPTAALVLMPFELIVSTTVLISANRAATWLGLGIGRRRWLVGVVAVVAWPVVALWGHGEDLVAVAFLLFALVDAAEGRWARMAWLLSLGILFQPLAATVAPLLLAATPQGKRIGSLVRMAAVPAAMVVIAFLGDAQDAFTQLVEQPTPPSVNHPTPWVNLSPKLTNIATGVQNMSVAHPVSHHLVGSHVLRMHPLVEVSGGAGRILYVLLAVALGLFVWRKPQPAVRLFWLAAAVLAARCFFEPVMTPYYLAPPLILCLVALARRPGRVFAAGCILSGEITWFAYFHLNEWLWWSVVVVGMAAVVALCYPVVGTDAPLDARAHDTQLEWPRGDHREPVTEVPVTPVLV